MKRGSRSRSLSSKIRTRVRENESFPGRFPRTLLKKRSLVYLTLEIREED
jgi:hypothetical protein